MNLFFENFMNGLISAGEIGELLARMILSLSLDYVTFEKFKQNPEMSLSYPHVRFVPSFANTPLFSRSIKLEEFLEGLVDPTYKADFQTKYGTCLYLIPEELRNAEVAFTSWSFLHSFPAEADIQLILETYFDRRAAMVLPANYPGADLLIPLRLAKKKKHNFVFSCILVQVKNRDNLKKKDHFLYGGDKLKPTVCPSGLRPPYMSISMELGGKSQPLPAEASGIHQKRDNQGGVKQSYEKIDIIQFRTSYPSHLLLIGFESLRICLMEPLREAFMNVCRRKVDNIHYETRKEILEITAPLKYIPDGHISGSSVGSKNDCKFHENS